MRLFPFIRRPLHWFVVSLLMGAAGGAQAQYKCRDSKGAVTYQQMPCAQEHTELTHNIRPNPAPEVDSSSSGSGSGSKSVPSPAQRGISTAARETPAPSQAAPAPSTTRTGMAPSGRPCRTAAEYAEIKRELDKNKGKPAPADADPSMAALSKSLFGNMDQKLADEMKACL